MPAESSRTFCGEPSGFTGKRNSQSHRAGTRVPEPTLGTSSDMSIMSPRNLKDRVFSTHGNAELRVEPGGNSVEGPEGINRENGVVAAGGPKNTRAKGP